MEQKHNGTYTQWTKDSVEQKQGGTYMQWTKDTVEQKQGGTYTQWTKDTVEQKQGGTYTQWTKDTVEQKHGGTYTQWTKDTVEHRTYPSKARSAQHCFFFLLFFPSHYFILVICIHQAQYIHPHSHVVQQIDCEKDIDYTVRIIHFVL